MKLISRLTNEEAAEAADALEQFVEIGAFPENDMLYLMVATALRRSSVINIDDAPQPVEDAIASETLLQSIAA